MSKYIGLPEQQFNQVVTFLVKLPFDQVAPVINLLQTSSKSFEVAEEAPVVEAPTPTPPPGPAQETTSTPQ